MFNWKRKPPKEIISKIGPYIEFTDPTPPKKEFLNMYDLIREAERFDHEEQYELSDEILNLLANYINKYVVNGKR